MRSMPALVMPLEMPCARAAVLPYAEAYSTEIWALSEAVT